MKKIGWGVLTGLIFYAFSSRLGAQPFEVQIGELFNQGQISRVNQMILQRLRQYPNDLTLWQELAALKISQGDDAGAVVADEEYLARKNDWQVRSDMALLLEQMGQFQNAATDIQRLYLLHPRDERVLWGMALWSEFQSQSKSFRTQPTAWQALADAQKYLRRLTDLQPQLALYRWQLAEVSRKLGEKDKALESYKEVLRLDPSFKWAHRYMARIWAEKKNYPQALSQYEEAIAIEPNDPELIREIQNVREKAPQVEKQVEIKEIKKWKAWTLPKEISISPSSVTIRVGLATDLTRLLVRSPSEIEVFSPVTVMELSPTPTPLALLPSRESYQVIYLTAQHSATHHEMGLIQNLNGQTLVRFTQKIWLIAKDSNQPLVLHHMPTNQGYFFGKDQDRAYREIIEIMPRKEEGFNVINRISLEAYVAGVLPSEMISSWPIEALKAQAIAARSYVLSNRNEFRREGFDVRDGVESQVYGGVGAETARTDSAVNETVGMVLKYHGKVIPAVFSAQCGGHTQDYEEAWGVKEPIVGVSDYDSRYNQDIQFPLSPYRLEEWIKGDPVSYCRMYGLKGYTHFRWVMELPVQSIQEKIPQVGRIRRLVVIRRSSAGWAQRLRIEGVKGQWILKGDTIRGFLGGLRSSLIWIEPQFNLKGWPEAFMIYGGGWGHGVGMCQVGAYGMALAGQTSREILKHYFPLESIEKF